MARVPASGLAKFFEGSPAFVDNESSIEKAVRMCLPNEETPLKSSQEFIDAANLQLFWPTKLTNKNQITNANIFRDYPTPTSSITNIEDSLTDNSLDVSFDIQLNNKVGYDIDFTVRFFSQIDVEIFSEQTETVTVFAGSTTGGGSFNWLRPGDFPGIMSYSLQILTSQQNPQYLPSSATQRNVSKPPPVTEFVIVTSYQQTQSECFIPFGEPELTHGLEFLGVNAEAKIALDIGGGEYVLGGNVPNGFYIQIDGNFRYTVLNGIVTSFINC